MDKFLSNVKGYIKKMDKKIQQKKDEIKKKPMIKEEYEDADDWIENKNLENEEDN